MTDMKMYEFTIYASADGRTPAQAWWQVIEEVNRLMAAGHEIDPPDHKVVGGDQTNTERQVE